jgi:hypothetical protein
LVHANKQPKRAKTRCGAAVIGMIAWGRAKIVDGIASDEWACSTVCGNQSNGLVRAKNPHWFPTLGPPSTTVNQH